MNSVLSDHFTIDVRWPKDSYPGCRLSAMEKHLCSHADFYVRYNMSGTKPINALHVAHSGKRNRVI